MSQMLERMLDELIDQNTALFQEDIDRFKEVGYRFMKGEITSAEFKAASGGMGVYAQRGGKEFMVRLRLLSGVSDLSTLNLIHDFAKDYKLEFVHFTTRQTIQLHHLQFDDVIDIMERSLKRKLITRGGGGNYPRNVSLSPLSGVAAEEAFDVTPYAIMVNKFFLSRITSYRLPRKFKVAFSNNSQDTGNASIADLGFLAVKKEEEKFFKVFIGGSLGVEGDISVPYDELIKADEILYHVLAALSLFTEEGDYENKSKARMRFIVKRMGAEAFLQCYKEHLKKVKEQDGFYYESEGEKEENLTQCESPKLNLNIPSNDSKDLIPQKIDGTYTINIHPQGGLLKVEDFNNILEFMEKNPNTEARLSMEESMYIRNLNEEQARELLNITSEVRKTTRLERSVSCIGVPICQIGIQESQMLLMNILSYFEEKGLREDILPSLHISGCPNSCARHQVNSIGFRGKKKRIGDSTKDVYTLYAGGVVSESQTKLAEEYGDLLAEEIPVFLYQLASMLKEKQVEFTDFHDQQKEDFVSLVQKYLV